jgi:hypothetical protein
MSKYWDNRAGDSWWEEQLYPDTDEDDIERPTTE